MKRDCITRLLLAGLLAFPLAANAEVASFKPTGGMTADEKGGMLNRPEGVGCSGKTIVVADTGNGRLLKYEYKDEGAYGGTELKFPQLPSPLRVQVLASGDFLVLDGKLRKIGRVGANGTFGGYLSLTGAAGVDPVIKAFFADAAGNIYVADIHGERVLVADGTGKVTRELPFPKGAGFITDVAVDSTGGVLLADGAGAVIWRRAKDGSEFVPLANLREHASFPSAITVDPRGTLYVLDENGGAIIVVGADGAFLGRRLSLGTKKGLIAYPAQACTDGAGTFFVADRDNSRIQIFTGNR